MILKNNIKWRCKKHPRGETSLPNYYYYLGGGQMSYAGSLCGEMDNQKMGGGGRQTSDIFFLGGGDTVNYQEVLTDILIEFTSFNNLITILSTFLRKWWNPKKI